jgi:hypothetical protein
MLVLYFNIDHMSFLNLSKLSFILEEKSQFRDKTSLIGLTPGQ